MLAYTTNQGAEKYPGVELVKASDEQMRQTLRYLSMGYSASRVSELFGMSISVTRVMKKGLK